MYCRNCGKEVKENAVVCINCGVPPLAKKHFCHECGVEIKENQVICIKCGASFETNSERKKTEVNEKHNWYQKPTWIYVLSFLFPPVGLYQLWKSQEISKKIKIIVTCAAILFVIGITSKDSKTSFDTVCCSCNCGKGIIGTMSYWRVPKEECQNWNGKIVSDKKCRDEAKARRSLGLE